MDMTVSSAGRRERRGWRAIYALAREEGRGDGAAPFPGLIASTIRMIARFAIQRVPLPDGTRRARHATRDGFRAIEIVRGKRNFGAAAPRWLSA
jgi:hypothetical protein